MSDAISAAAAGVTAKLAGLSFGAIVAIVVVMAMTRPRSTAEWVTALVSTIMASVAGGSYLAIHFGLDSLDATVYGMASIIGLAFAAGLPAWVMVRIGFSWMANGDGRNLLELIREIRRLRHGGRDE